MVLLTFVKMPLQKKNVTVHWMKFKKKEKKVNLTDIFMLTFDQFIYLISAFLH